MDLTELNKTITKLTESLDKIPFKTTVSHEDLERVAQSNKIDACDLLRDISKDIPPEIFDEINHYQNEYFREKDGTRELQLHYCPFAITDLILSSPHHRLLVRLLVDSYLHSRR